MSAKTGKPRIVAWIKPYCPWCQGFLAMLKSHGLEAEIRDVVASRECMDEMVRRTKQSKAPCAEIDGNLLIDTSDQEAEAWLREHGYLKPS